MLERLRFTGKKALVTGAAGGIGLALVSALCVQVAAADRDTASVDADVHLPGDLLETGYTEEGLPAAAADGLGGLDIVVNNAGGSGGRNVSRPMECNMTVNLTAPFLLIKAALPTCGKPKVRSLTSAPLKEWDRILVTSPIAPRSQDCMV